MFENLNAYSFLLVAANLLILYIVLRKILFKPVTEFMEKRTKSIADSVDDAAKLKAEALEMKRMYEKQMKDAKSDGEKIINEAAEIAARNSDKIISDAKHEANVIMANARKEIEREREQMQKHVYNQVVELSIEAASKIIESNMDTEKNKKITDKFLKEEGVA